MGGFARRRGGIEVLLGEEERRLLALALRLLEDVEAADEDDPAVTRLRYSAHPEDAAADDRFRRLTGDMLEEARRLDRRTLAATLHAAHLSDEQAESWIRVIAEARLALGARAGIAEDGWEGEYSAGSPPPPAVALVHLMGRLQDLLVETLLS